MKERKLPLPKEVAPFLIAEEDFTIDQTAQLGMGLTGCVYEGAYRDEVVAVKLFSLRDSKLTEAEQLDYSQKAVHEAQMLSQLQSKHIIQLRGITYLYRHYTVVMEKAAHFPLYLNHRKISLQQQLAWALQITIALQEAHSKDIIHRDLRLGNLLIDREAQIKLADFGTAIKLGAVGELKEKNQHFMDACQGQPEHTAPEVQRGFLFSKSSDIYSLGTLFCELLYPNKQVSTTLGESQTLPNSCPLEFKKIISDCWRLNSGLRPSAQQVRIYLEKVLYHFNQPVKLIQQPQEKPSKRISAMKIGLYITKSFTLFAKLPLGRLDISVSSQRFTKS